MLNVAPFSRIAIVRLMSKKREPRVPEGRTPRNRAVDDTADTRDNGGDESGGGQNIADQSDMSEATDGDDEEVARVIVATVADLGAWIPEAIGTEHATRPVWFHLPDSVNLVCVFVRHPERPLPRRPTDASLAGLRAFCVDQNQSLQRVLGITDEMQYGFHANVSFEQVVKSFEADGFEVVRAIHAGKVATDRLA